MTTIRVRALRAVAGLQREEVAEVEDTPYVQSAIDAGHLERADEGPAKNNGGNGGNGGGRRSESAQESPRPSI